MKNSQFRSTPLSFAVFIILAIALFAGCKKKTEGGLIDDMNDSIPDPPVVINPPCFNTISSFNFLHAANYDMNFYSVHYDPSADIIRANSSNGDLNIQFYYTDPDLSKNIIYNVSGCRTNSNPNTASIEIVLGSLPPARMCPSGPGKVYIEVKNDSIIATFCDVPFQHDVVTSYFDTLSCKLKFKI